jgi:hypothetical protein
MSKYHSKKVTVDGITFDSKREANRYRELLLLERAGAISHLKRQVRFPLLPAVYEEYERYSKVSGKRLTNGRRCIERAVFYVADFCYTQDGKPIVEDVKGHRTKEYILKRKMMRFFHGIEVKEI